MHSWEEKLYEETEMREKYLFFKEWKGSDLMRGFLVSKEYTRTMVFGRAIIEHHRDTKFSEDNELLSSDLI